MSETSSDTNGESSFEFLNDKDPNNGSKAKNCESSDDQLMALKALTATSFNSNFIFEIIISIFQNFIIY